MRTGDSTRLDELKLWGGGCTGVDCNPGTDAAGSGGLTLCCFDSPSHNLIESRLCCPKRPNGESRDHYTLRNIWDPIPESVDGWRTCWRIPVLYSLEKTMRHTREVGPTYQELEAESLRRFGKELNSTGNVWALRSGLGCFAL